MNASKYLVRVGKYIIQLVILVVIIFGLMNIVSNQPNNTTFSQMFLSSNGLLFLGVVLVFALAYPFFGFTKRTLTFDVKQHADEVEKVMNMCGFILVSDQNDVLTYKAKTVAKKIMLMYEDTITISNNDGVYVVEGARKEVVRVSMRFDTFIELNK